MKYLMSAEWWKAAGIRAAKTMFQTGAALVVTQMPRRHCGLGCSWQRGYCGRCCVPWHQPCRSAGTGEGG